jgi:DHA1 family multidrug resistance protein-like MFS transporter
MEPWARNQYVITATVFVVFTGFAFVIPFLPLYVRELGVTDPETATLWAGVLIGISPLLAGLLAPVWGRLADRRGHKAMVVRALVSYVVLLVLSALVRNVYELLACRIGIGLFGGIGPIGLAMATSGAPREQTGRAVGLVQSAQILSAAVGPFAGGFLADLIGRRNTFLVTALVCAAALVLVLRLYREAPRAAGAASPAATTSMRALIAWPGVSLLLAALFIVNFAGRAITPVLPAHLERLGVPPDRLALHAGILISAYAAAAAVSAALLGRASRTRSPWRLLAASLLTGAAIVGPMAVAPTYQALVGLAVLLGLASGGALTLCYTIGGLMMPSEHKATAFGFFSGAALFGGALSPSVTGLVAHVALLGIYWVNAALFVGLALAVLPRALAPPPPAGEPLAPLRPETRSG